MEEIYKPDAEDTEKVEIYSRENNDMLGDMPEWLIHTGSYIVYGLIVLLIAGTALFKYPDTIKKHYHRRYGKCGMDYRQSYRNDRPLFYRKPVTGKTE